MMFFLHSSFPPFQLVYFAPPILFVWHVERFACIHTLSPLDMYIEADTCLYHRWAPCEPTGCASNNTTYNTNIIVVTNLMTITSVTKNAKFLVDGCTPFTDSLQLFLIVSELTARRRMFQLHYSSLYQTGYDKPSGILMMTQLSLAVLFAELAKLFHQALNTDTT